MFAQDFEFALPTGSRSLPSYTGTFFSASLIILLIFYGVMELVALVAFGDSIITAYEIDSHFTSQDIFDIDKAPGIQVALGLTMYDGNYEPIDEPEYGEVKA